MAFNRKPEKQILQQHRFEEFNQNSISKLISLRSTTHWHVLADSEQLQKASWNNTLSGAPAAGPHQPGAQAFLTSTLGGPGPGPRGGSARALRLWRGGLRRGAGRPENHRSRGSSLWKLLRLFQSPTGIPNSNNSGREEKIQSEKSMWLRED